MYRRGYASCMHWPSSWVTKNGKEDRVREKEEEGGEEKCIGEKEAQKSVRKL